MLPSLSLSFVGALALLCPSSWGFLSTSHRQFAANGSSCHRPATSVAYSNWDAFDTRDSVELMIGGTRYEMVELPDSMMSTTLWVGNLCEFVTDEMLSELFQRTSSLKFVPACVARKPNYESMKYGFVTFRSEEEKEVSTVMRLLLSCIVNCFANNSASCTHSCHCLHSSLSYQDGNVSPTRIRIPRQTSQGRINQGP